jgi:hypothetical protein
MDATHLGTAIVDLFKFADAGYSIATDYLPPHTDFDKAAGRFRNLPSMAVVMFRKVPIGMCHANGVVLEPSEGEEAAVFSLREFLAEYDAAMVSKAKKLANIPDEHGPPRNLLWWSSVAIVGCREDSDFAAMEDKNPSTCDGVAINSAWATLPKDVGALTPLKRVGGQPPRVVSFSVDSRVNVSREFAKGWRIDTFVEINTLWELVVESHLVRHVKAR